MNNYKVKALINFDDVEAGEKRIANKSEWLCSAERYTFLKEHNAVELIEIIPREVPTVENVDEAMQRIEESAKEEVKLEIKKKTSKKSKK